MHRRKVVVGMSGGVDSAVAAYLLKKQGFDVTGVTLRTWTAGDNRCCEIVEAGRTANQLSFPFYTWNVSLVFREKIIEPFIAEYLQGRTPNPCVRCNRHVKWEWLLHAADVLGAEFIATGHYAQVRRRNGIYSVGMAKDTEKDQSYMLYRLTQEQLSRTLFPLADFAKRDVRKIAEEIGLSVHDKADSQEICFAIGGNYADCIEQTYEDTIPADGNFVDECGNNKSFCGQGILSSPAFYLGKCRYTSPAICNTKISGTPYLNFRCCVLCRKSRIAANAPILPPTAARARSVISGTRHLCFLAHSLSQP